MSTLGPLIVGFEGMSLTPSVKKTLLHPSVGGVILFARNFESPEQLHALCQEIKALRSPELLISVDQEGGRVQRFKAGFTPLPPLALLGRWYDTHPDRALDLAYRHGRVMAAEVLAHGVDLSWAPVFDLNGISGVIGNRAMAASAEAVVALGRYYIAGMRDAGMVACGKHYPGHGSVEADTHLEGVVDPRPVADLMQDEAPFRALASELALVMMAHVVYPAVCEKPAGFSKTWIHQRLRQDIGFKGLVVSDDLDMVGAHAAGPLPSRLQTAFEAGCDLVLVCQPESVMEVLHGDWPMPDPMAMASLKGRPMLSLEEQLQVSEFRFWRQSLAQLAQEHT